MKGAFETMGVKGIIPFYKDIKDYVGRNDFQGEEQAYSPQLVKLGLGNVQAGLSALKAQHFLTLFTSQELRS